MKFLVFKVEDIEKVCDQKQLVELYKIARMIRIMRENEGRNPDPNYLVVNTDESYADKVKSIIEENEGEKVSFE